MPTSGREIRRRRPALAAPVSARSIQPRCVGCLPQSTPTHNSDKYRRACSHFCLWRINSPFAPMSKRFSRPHRRRWSSAWVNSRIPSWKETLAIVFRNAAADRFTRRFYPPPVGRINAAAMFWKASKRERPGSGRRALWGGARSCALGRLVVLGEVVAQLRVQRSTWRAPRCLPSRRLAPNWR